MINCCTHQSLTNALTLSGFIDRHAFQVELIRAFCFNDLQVPHYLVANSGNQYLAQFHVA